MTQKRPRRDGRSPTRRQKTEHAPIKTIPWMKIEKPMMWSSIVIMSLCVLIIGIKGLALGLDFTGGVSADVHYQAPVEQTQVIDALAQGGFLDPVVQYLGARDSLLVRLPPQGNVDTLAASLTQALNLEGNAATVENLSVIGAQVGGDIYTSSIWAIFLALGSMLAYVALRFEYKLAIGAVCALFHDAIVTLGIFALFGWPFDLTVLAAILALIGYSLNDTIVVYDRIRENFRKIRGVTPRQIMDISLTETLRRTIMTISTILLVVFAMLFLGGEGLKWFSVALLIGLIAGTYSSAYIAPVLPLWLGITKEDFAKK